MDIYLYNFTKRVNSTKQPAEDGLQVSVNLKNDTSIYSPIFMLSSIENLSSYTYLKWENRYYYIVDVIKSTIKNVWEINTTLDVLATYKNDIANTTAFVLYSSSNYNSMLPDNRLSMNATPIVDYNIVNLVDFTPTLGTYILSYITNVTGGYAPIGIKYLSAVATNQLANALMSDGIIDTMTEIVKQLGSAKDSIISCKYVPIAWSQTGSSLVLGTYQTNIVCGNPNRLHNYSVNIAIPWHYNDFRRRSEHTSLLLFLPAYGFVELNSNDFIDTESINIRCIVDGFTGEATYIIGGERGQRVVTSFALDIPLSANKTDQIGALSQNVGGLVAFTAGAISGNGIALAGGAGALFNGIRTSMQHSTGSVGSLGGLSSVIGNISAEEGGDIYCITITRSTNIDPSSIIDTIGRPLNAIRKIDGLSGYIQTSEFSVNTNAPDQIKDQINNFMNGGIYYE